MLETERIKMNTSNKENTYSPRENVSDPINNIYREIKGMRNKLNKGDIIKAAGTGGAFVLTAYLISTGLQPNLNLGTNMAFTPGLGTTATNFAIVYRHDNGYLTQNIINSLKYGLPSGFLAYFVGKKYLSGVKQLGKNIFGKNKK